MAAAFYSFRKRIRLSDGHDLWVVREDRNPCVTLSITEIKGRLKKRYTILLNEGEAMTVAKTLALTKENSTDFQLADGHKMWLSRTSEQAVVIGFSEQVGKIDKIMLIEVVQKEAEEIAKVLAAIFDRLPGSEPPDEEDTIPERKIRTYDDPEG
jgi:hypothetical protein